MNFGNDVWLSQSWNTLKCAVRFHFWQVFVTLWLLSKQPFRCVRYMFDECLICFSTCVETRTSLCVTKCVCRCTLCIVLMKRFENDPKVSCTVPSATYHEYAFTTFIHLSIFNVAICCNRLNWLARSQRKLQPGTLFCSLKCCKRIQCTVFQAHCNICVPWQLWLSCPQDIVMSPVA